MVLKLAIHDTNRLRIYADTVQIINLKKDVFPRIRVFRGCLNSIIRKKKKARNVSYFLGCLDYKIWIGKKKIIFFHSKTKGKLNSDYKIWKSHGHFIIYKKKKKKGVREKWVEGKKYSYFFILSNGSLCTRLLGQCNMCYKTLRIN